MSNIRPFSTSDKVALVTLFEEMQRHYGVACPPTGVIESNLAALPAGVEIIVAETDRIIGFAAFSAIFRSRFEVRLVHEGAVRYRGVSGNRGGEGPDLGGCTCGGRAGAQPRRLDGRPE